MQDGLEAGCHGPWQLQHFQVGLHRIRNLQLVVAQLLRFLRLAAACSGLHPCNLASTGDCAEPRTEPHQPTVDAPSASPGISWNRSASSVCCYHTSWFLKLAEQDPNKAITFRSKNQKISTFTAQDRKLSVHATCPGRCTPLALTLFFCSFCAPFLMRRSPHRALKKRDLKFQLCMPSSVHALRCRLPLPAKSGKGPPESCSLHILPALRLTVAISVHRRRYLLARLVRTVACRSTGNAS